MSFVIAQVYQSLTPGLQFAYRVVRPQLHEPGQANRAYEIISGKLGQVKGFP